MNTPSLEELWEDLRPALVSRRTSSVQEERLRLAFLGGAFALFGVLAKASYTR